MFLLKQLHYWASFFIDFAALYADNAYNQFGPTEDFFIFANSADTDEISHFYSPWRDGDIRKLSILDTSILLKTKVLLLWIFYVFVLSCVCYVFVRVCLYVLVVTCWERADLLALACGVYYEFATFPLVSWVRCGTWLYRFLIFAPLLTFIRDCFLWAGIHIPLARTGIVIDRKHFIKYWLVWFEHCGYMWHICLPNASQSYVIRPIGWFNIVYQGRHHVVLKRFQWKCHAENVFKNVLVHTIWSVYDWIP